MNLLLKLFEPVTGIVLAVIIAILFVVLAPFATLWALNTLFPVLAIPYTFDTWLASCLIHMLFKNTIEIKK